MPLSGSFAALAVASAVARLVTYLSVCATTLRLRTRAFGTVAPPTFVIPMGALVPLLAILLTVLMLAAATRAQLLGGAAALGIGAALFVINGWVARRQHNTLADVSAP